MQFTLNDYLDQMQQLKKMGPLSQVMNMLPGMNAKALQGVDMEKGEREMQKNEAIIKSMTKREREEPQVINGSRRKRIANGSGTSVQEVNRLLNSFEDMKKMFKMLADGGKRGGKGMGKFKMPF